MKGYKAFNPDLTCRGMQYEVGKSYFIVEKPVLCERGFHFCKEISDCDNYYKLLGTDNRVCEVEASGTIIHEGDKCVTDQLYVVKELSRIEINRVMYTCYGDRNGYGNGYYGNSFGNGSGDGYYGNGNGYGYGNGDYGNGNGYGNGYYGNSFGNGSGDGYGAITRVLIFK